MHPFYGPSGRLLGGRGSQLGGLVSMAAYLAFWAAVVAVAKRELDARLPRVEHGQQGEPALAELRLRFARGEIDADEYRAMMRVLDPGAAGAG